jgi:hypothetical protein
MSLAIDFVEMSLLDCESLDNHKVRDHLPIELSVTSRSRGAQIHVPYIYGIG